MSVRIIGNQRFRAAQWASDRFGVQIDPSEKFTALILERDFDILACVFYTDYAPENTIDVHLAAVPGRRWLTRPFLSAAFRYPFLQLGVRRMGASIAADNADSLRWTRHCGFTHEGTKRKAGMNGVDVLIFGLLKEECRFLDGPAPEIWSIDSGQAECTSTPRSSSNSQRTGRSEQGIGYRDCGA